MIQVLVGRRQLDVALHGVRVFLRPHSRHGGPNRRGLHIEHDLAEIPALSLGSPGFGRTLDIVGGGVGVLWAADAKNGSTRSGLGATSFYEVLATYIGMAASVTLFGMICVAASSYFTRTIAALVVSYLIVLPLTLVGILFYSLTSSYPRMFLVGGFLPICCLVAAGVLLVVTSRRLLHPPDVGAEAKDVVDPDMEQKMAVGMVIRSDQFPDKLFAPPEAAI